MFRALVDRGEPRERAQRFTLQCVVAMFVEARGERFNSGVFKSVDPVPLTSFELELLRQAADDDWSKIDPVIFGTLLQASMTEAHRHRSGAHYTLDADIQRVVLPTIVRPFRERIDAANSLSELGALRAALVSFKVLDPACGSGNFLYVAYRELKRLELELLQKIRARSSDETGSLIGASTGVSTRQLYGIDTDPFAVELAKVTLMLGEKPAPDQVYHHLDKNICKGDALFCPWPKVDVIIGNPPFQSKNKMQEELGAEYVKRVRAAYPDVPGRTDYCVYWFRRAHDELPEGGRAGLVGTNTIRQNYSREGGLDYILGDGGTITEAVSSQVWPGEAVVHVSIVNWIKGRASGKKRLFTQLGDQLESPWELTELDRIPASLSAGTDVTQAKPLAVNSSAEVCHQGQTHGHEGFLLTPDEAAQWRGDPAAHRVLHPYLTGDDLVGRPDAQPSRFIIDLNDCDDVLSARKHGAAFVRLRARVKPDIEESARAEREELGKASGPRQSHAQRWWKYWRARGELIDRLRSIPRYIACSRVTKRPIFAFVASSIRPNDALMAFSLPDDYSFGILQSEAHWAWFRARCSTMKGDFRYTSNTVFDSFAWPEAPLPRQVQAVAASAVALRALRRRLATEHGMTLRKLYATLEDSGKHPLKEAHAALDAAVRAAYGMTAREDVLAFLLAQNQALSAREARGEAIPGPGLPAWVKDAAAFVSDDCVRAPKP